MRTVLWVVIALVMASCGESRPAAPAASESASASASAAPAGAISGRPVELANPDEATMVLLYFDLAGTPPPVEQWLDDDMRVRLAPASQKPAARDLVRREIEAGIDGVRNVGAIRLSLRANLSEYDDTYGEFTVRALAPSSVIQFEHFGYKVALKFGNARTAQVWHVPADQAQAVRDRLGDANDASIDALLRIGSVHASPDGGTLTTQVLEYELRASRGGALLGRVQPAPQS
jgi:hypothetical protein